MTLTVAGKRVRLFPSEVPGAPLVLLNGEGNEGERVFSLVRELTDAPFSLAVIGDIDWNAELTPWPAPAAFRDGGDFSGQADGYIRALTGEILPGIARTLGDAPAYTALAGYSLAGLFALYAPYRTDVFSRVASVSGSLWYPGIMAYIQDREWVRRPDCLYLSVGDREGATRNPVMKPVEANTRAAAALYEGKGVPTTLELNPGGHFNAPDRRIAKGIAWLLERP